MVNDYDFIVIDTPPSLGVLTVNAFTCATDILIPTTAGIFATAGISQLSETVNSVQKYPRREDTGHPVHQIQSQGKYQPADQGANGTAERVHIGTNLSNLHSRWCSSGGGPGQ